MEDDEQQGAWWTTPPRPPSSADEPDPVVDLRDPPPPVVHRTTPLPPTARGTVDADPPTRPVEYLTVRLDPDNDHRGFSDTMEVPAAAMPRRQQGSAPADDDEGPRRLPFRRGPAILIGVGVLAVIVAVSVIASLVVTGVDGGRESGSEAVPAARAQFGGTPPAALAQVSADRAQALLGQAGQNPAGQVQQAFVWDDDNGRNLLVTTVARSTRGSTLSVLHVGGLDARPRVLRSMVDPNLPLNCTSGTEQAGFTEGSVFVRDLNSDGVAEATVGWTSRCGDAERSNAKLALISDGRKFIIRGDGVIGRTGSGAGKPDPDTADWPADYLSSATTLYRSLYF